MFFRNDFSLYLKNSYRINSNFYFNQKLKFLNSNLLILTYTTFLKKKGRRRSSFDSIFAKHTS
jgi:hypothetical protein